MTSSREELLDLARADIGLAVAIDEAGDDPAAADSLRTRQRAIQRRMRHLQQRILLSRQFPAEHSASRIATRDTELFAFKVRPTAASLPRPDEPR